jgi:GNAT superfamily N-acetyltransferase
MMRVAQQHDAKILTNISFASKGYWGYPQQYFETWSTELTITPEYIDKHDVFVYENDGVISGYYSIVELPVDIELSGITISAGFWLEHMFVEPLHIGKGIGAIMFKHLREQHLNKKIYELKILSDPNARGFYEKMGCQYVREYPSTIKNRTTSYLLLHL